MIEFILWVKPALHKKYKDLTICSFQEKIEIEKALPMTITTYDSNVNDLALQLAHKPDDYGIAKLLKDATTEWKIYYFGSLNLIFAYLIPIFPTMTCYSERN